MLQFVQVALLLPNPSFLCRPSDLLPWSAGRPQTLHAAFTLRLASSKVSCFCAFILRPPTSTSSFSVSSRCLCQERRPTSFAAYNYHAAYYVHLCQCSFCRAWWTNDRSVLVRLYYNNRCCARLFLFPRS